MSMPIDPIQTAKTGFWAGVAFSIARRISTAKNSIASSDPGHHSNLFPKRKKLGARIFFSANEWLEILIDLQAGSDPYIGLALLKFIAGLFILITSLIAFVPLAPLLVLGSPLIVVTAVISLIVLAMALSLIFKSMQEIGTWATIDHDESIEGQTEEEAAARQTIAPERSPRMEKLRRSPVFWAFATITALAASGMVFYLAFFLLVGASLSMSSLLLGMLLIPSFIAGLFLFRRALINLNLSVKLYRSSQKRIKEPKGQYVYILEHDKIKSMPFAPKLEDDEHYNISNLLFVLDAPLADLEKLNANQRVRELFLAFEGEPKEALILLEELRKNDYALLDLLDEIEQPDKAFFESLVEHILRDKSPTTTVRVEVHETAALFTGNDEKRRVVSSVDGEKQPLLRGMIRRANIGKPANAPERKKGVLNLDQNGARTLGIVETGSLSYEVTTAVSFRRIKEEKAEQAEPVEKLQESKHPLSVKRAAKGHGRIVRHARGGRKQEAAKGILKKAKEGIKEGVKAIVRGGEAVLSAAADGVVGLVEGAARQGRLFEMSAGEFKAYFAKLPPGVEVFDIQTTNSAALEELFTEEGGKLKYTATIDRINELATQKLLAEGKLTGNVLADAATSAAFKKLVFEELLSYEAAFLQKLHRVEGGGRTGADASRVSDEVFDQFIGKILAHCIKSLQVQEQAAAAPKGVETLLGHSKQHKVTTSRALPEANLLLINSEAFHDKLNTIVALVAEQAERARDQKSSGASASAKAGLTAEKATEIALFDRLLADDVKAIDSETGQSRPSILRELSDYGILPTEGKPTEAEQRAASANNVKFLGEPQALHEKAMEDHKTVADYVNALVKQRHQAALERHQQIMRDFPNFEAFVRHCIADTGTQRLGYRDTEDKKEHRQSHAIVFSRDRLPLTKEHRAITDKKTFAPKLDRLAALISLQPAPAMRVAIADSILGNLGMLKVVESYSEEQFTSFIEALDQLLALEEVRANPSLLATALQPAISTENAQASLSAFKQIVNSYREKALEKRLDDFIQKLPGAAPTEQKEIKEGKEVTVSVDTPLLAAFRATLLSPAALRAINQYPAADLEAFFAALTTFLEIEGVKEDPLIIQNMMRSEHLASLKAFQTAILGYKLKAFVNKLDPKYAALKFSLLAQLLNPGVLAAIRAYNAAEFQEFLALLTELIDLQALTAEKAGGIVSLELNDGRTEAVNIVINPESLASIARFQALLAQYRIRKARGDEEKKQLLAAQRERDEKEEKARAKIPHSVYLVSTGRLLKKKQIVIKPSSESAPPETKLLFQYPDNLPPQAQEIMNSEKLEPVLDALTSQPNLIGTKLFQVILSDLSILNQLNKKSYDTKRFAGLLKDYIKYSFIFYNNLQPHSYEAQSFFDACTDPKVILGYASDLKAFARNVAGNKKAAEEIIRKQGKQIASSSSTASRSSSSSSRRPPISIASPSLVSRSDSLSPSESGHDSSDEEDEKALLPKGKAKPKKRDDSLPASELTPLVSSRSRVHPPHNDPENHRKRLKPGVRHQGGGADG